jgi:hypothetical protein
MKSSLSDCPDCHVAPNIETYPAAVFVVCPSCDRSADDPDEEVARESWNAMIEGELFARGVA